MGRSTHNRPKEVLLKTPTKRQKLSLADVMKKYKCYKTYDGFKIVEERDNGGFNSNNRH